MFPPGGCSRENCGNSATHTITSLITNIFPSTVSGPLLVVWNCYLFISYWWILHVFTIEYKYCTQHYLKHDGCCWPWPQALTASVKWHGSSAASWWSCTPTWIRCIRICWSTLPLIQRRPPWRSYSLISATSEPCSWWVKIAVSRVQSVKVDATSCVPQSFDMRASKWYVWLSHWLPFVSTSSHLCWYGASWKTHDFLFCWMLHPGTEAK